MTAAGLPRRQAVPLNGHLAAAPKGSFMCACMRIPTVTCSASVLSVRKIVTSAIVQGRGGSPKLTNELKATAYEERQ